MIPAELKAEDFRSYPAESQRVAMRYLEVLRRLPAAVCPSFLQQIQNIPTSFPVETRLLCMQLDALKAMPLDGYNAIAEPLRRIDLTKQIYRLDWVNQPATFVTEMTAWLWSSGQIDRFRQGAHALFAALPQSQSNQGRLVMIVMGQGARSPEPEFGRLRKMGVLVRNFNEPDVAMRLVQAVTDRAAADPAPYAHWYVDGGTPWSVPAYATGVQHVSYRSLAPLRVRVLARMKDSIFSGDAGTEALQTRLSGLTPEALGAGEIVSDPVLQRFYTELFTLSSGPQIFSTSFTQWAGRELMRRAQPKTVLLRYAPRQHHRSFDEMVAQAEAETTLDPEGSLRDAEMGAYYGWLETRRMAPSSAITFLVWLEETSKLLVIAPSAPAGTETSTPLTLNQILAAFS
jgi:hypothetical protein